MPTVFEAFGYRFFFYSNENDEPIHIHISKAGAEAKYWIVPEIAEEYSYGFKLKERKEIKKLVTDNADKITQHWTKFFA
jgi:Domain of unknown function (DUF4160)